jgi:hypothetical protein
MNNRNNRATRVIVASGSLLAIIVIGIPLADDYFALRRDAAEFADLQSRLAQNQSRDLRFSQVQAKLTEELSALADRSIDPTKMHWVRETLVNIVRNAGGRLRRLETPDGDARPWATRQDDPRQEIVPLFEEESNFLLHTHRVELQADGSLETIRKIVGDIRNQGWLMSTKMLTARPTGVKESPVTIELQFMLYGLVPSEQEADEFEDDEDLASLAQRRRTE